MPKSAPKIILRIFLMLILLAIGASLFFYKDITNYYREWKKPGSSEESIALPQNMGNSSTEGSGFPALAPGQPEGSAQPAGQIPTEEEAMALLNQRLSNGTENGGASSGQAAEGGMEVTSSSGQQVKVGGIAPPLHEDSVVSNGFIADLASFLVNSYYPPGTHANASGGKGYTSASLLGLNVRYGTELGEFFKRDRAETLKYVLAPSMLEALYRLYANRFLATMQQIASEDTRLFKGGSRKMTESEQRMMFSYYSTAASGVAAVFEACASSPSIVRHLDAYYAASLEAYNKNKEYIEASIANDQAEPGQAADAKVVLAGAKTVYEQSVIERENARNELLRNLKRYPGVRALDDSNILYTAAWINRRLADKSADADNLAAVSRILTSLAERMRELGK